MHVATHIDFGIADRPRKRSVILNRRDWGLAATQNSTRIATIEKAMDLLGTSALFASAAIIIPALTLQLLMNGFQTPEGLWGELLGAFTIAVSGMLLRIYGQLGLRKHIEVDINRGEVRLGYVFGGRKPRRWMRIKQSNISSAFLLRSKEPGKPTRLVLRMKDSNRAVSVFKGPELELRKLLTEIVQMADRHENGSIAVRKQARA